MPQCQKLDLNTSSIYHRFGFTAKNWDSWKRAHLPPKPPPKVREVLANGYDDDDDDHHGPITPEGEHFPPTAAPH